jgi:cell division protein FtsN
VSSSQNPDWAEDLARQLREVGLVASVLKPRREGDGYRVVLGPYDSRETAESEGRKLGRPFFIYQPESQQ